MSDLIFSLFEVQLAEFIEELIFIALTASGLGFTQYIRTFFKIKKKSNILKKVSSVLKEENQELFDHIVEVLDDKEKKELDKDMETKPSLKEYYDRLIKK